jgi:peptidyl-prolyl cis-trans isomerase B (cyclophilin B)
LAANPETASAAAFRLTHRTPGTVSLALGTADGEGDAPLRGRPATGFRITTGPGPVPALDGQNIVIGRVTSGMEVVAALARVQTYAPLSTARQWNALAGALGDNRAAKARFAWVR